MDTQFTYNNQTYAVSEENRQALLDLLNGSEVMPPVIVQQPTVIPIVLQNMANGQSVIRLPDTLVDEPAKITLQGMGQLQAFKSPVFRFGYNMLWLITTPTLPVKENGKREIVMREFTVDSGNMRYTGILDIGFGVVEKLTKLLGRPIE